MHHPGRVDPARPSVAAPLLRSADELFYLIADLSIDDARKWQDATGWLERHSLDRLIDEVRELGLASHEKDPGEKLAKAMHDVRGGAPSSLLGRMQMLTCLRTQPSTLNILFVQARDHLKIMRNAVIGSDETRREADRKPNAHAMALMLDKW